MSKKKCKYDAILTLLTKRTQFYAKNYILYSNLILSMIHDLISIWLISNNYDAKIQATLDEHLHIYGKLLHISHIVTSVPL